MDIVPVLFLATCLMTIVHRRMIGKALDQSQGLLTSFIRKVDHSWNLGANPEEGES